ncbi:MAG: hypothetical protein DMF56_19470 [Acidobacteria bacterium]|nr:MAG: hypothetical protein DMF56_19470 [Acidobacteriota bacterium]
MASPSETFISTLTQTPSLAGALQANLQRLKNNNDQIITVLTYTKTVADKLDKLDDTLKLVSDLLTVVSVIPEVGQAASALKNSIALLSREVTPARQAADRLEAKVKPFREALQKLNSVLDQGIQTTGQIQSTSQSFLDKFTTVFRCVQSLPDRPVKNDLQSALDQFAGTVQTPVATLNTALDTANKAIDTFYAALQKVKDALNPLKAIADAIDTVMNVLSPVIGPLQALKDALMSIEIMIPIPYPHMVKLYDVFKLFGSFIDLAMKPIQALVDKVLEVLHITLPSIPGLSDLINLHIDLPGIPNFPDLLLKITNPFNDFNVKIPTFNVKCPP